MVYAVLPALVPEIPKVYDVYFAAFKNEAMGNIMLDVLFPDQDISSEEFRKGHTEATRNYWGVSSVQYTYKCVDTDTGDIVGVILGDIYVSPRSEEERKNYGVPWLEGDKRERAEKVLNPLWEAREKLFGGRPYIYVHVIGVDPRHQGRKAGAAIVKWGIDICEQTKLPVYFEASPTTVGLYEKLGYNRLRDSIVHKAETLGTEADIVVPLMVRMPSAAGMTFDEWRDKDYPSF
ncbi:hypothetical protein GQ53DRAFT_356382 [Thozetella sp. PMI_491]|nr:hypothetical protein GQ53DRAFT_356382 [Thozetella sp. PMI_491]